MDLQQYIPSVDQLFYYLIPFGAASCLLIFLKWDRVHQFYDRMAQCWKSWSSEVRKKDSDPSEKRSKPDAGSKSVAAEDENLVAPKTAERRTIEIEEVDESRPQQKQETKRVEKDVDEE